MAFRQSKRIYKYLFFALLLFAGLYFVYLIRGLLLAMVLALILVYLLYPVVRSMEARGTHPVLAILLAYAGVSIVAAAVMMYGIPRLVLQLHLLVDMLPTYTAQVEQLMIDIQTTYSRTGVPDGLRVVIDQQINDLELRLQKTLEQLVDSIFNMVGYVLNIVLAPVLAFYILKDLDKFKLWIESRFPEKYFPGLWSLSRQINTVLSSFIRGHLILMVFVGTLTGLAMVLLGVEYAVMLGIIAGLTELIPYFGPFIGAVPAVAIALLHSKVLALKVVLAIIVIQQIESYIIAPKVLGHSVGLHPLTIILVLLAGLEFYGVVGMLLAVPVAAIIRVLLVHGYQFFSKIY
ncbi:AI-2E family transporter [Desulfofalx alkaliphila]|uniref:AI-2E family transporter n=1 Tax=Desulfofalx alkaliphila TaxID=105483 RepID=UPI0004E19DBC|nr:AI-2E family transporter [Desulfofalx alkaliphila]